MTSGGNPGELRGLLTEGQDLILSAGSDASAPLVVLLHGHGGTEHDMAADSHGVPGLAHWMSAPQLQYASEHLVRHISGRR